MQFTELCLYLNYLLFVADLKILLQAFLNDRKHITLNY